MVPCTTPSPPSDSIFAQSAHLAPSCHTTRSPAGSASRNRQRKHTHPDHLTRSIRSHIEIPLHLLCANNTGIAHSETTASNAHSPLIQKPHRKNQNPAPACADARSLSNAPADRAASRAAETIERALLVRPHNSTGSHPRSEILLHPKDSPILRTASCFFDRRLLARSKPCHRAQTPFPSPWTRPAARSVNNANPFAENSNMSLEYLR